MSQEGVKTRRGFKEFIRKLMVSLKRNPQNISLIMLVIAFGVYSLNLTAVSNTTAVIQGDNMGQCEFVAMLFSILAFVVFLRSFPKRKKPNMIMLGLLMLFLILLIGVDFVYIMRIDAALTRDVSPIDIEKYPYVATAKSIVMLHIIFTAVCAVLVATLPIYSKLIRKINTSIEVEENLNMGTIDISGED